jgi:hypothetical protein
MLNAAKTDLNLEKLKQIVTNRTEHLTSQVLQDLVSHFQTKPASGPQTVYGRVSLLDATKKPKDESGFIMNERTQCLDMKAIYDKLDGAAIVFDVASSAAPFVDESGVIHMPKDCAAPKVEKTTLRTIFANISGQGNTRNYGIQKEINREALEKLGQLKAKAMTPQEKESYEHLKTLLEMLDAKFTMMDSFKVAAQLTEFMHSLNIYMSVNCYGGKDRTAYLEAVNTHLHLKKMLKAQYPQEKRVPLSKKDRALLKRWNLELLSEASVAAGVIQDNAGHTIIKLSRFDLELYETTTVKGLATRIQDLTRAGKMFAHGKQTSISDTPGQLYNDDFKQ